MGQWVDYSERLQMNLALVKKCLSDAGVEPWLQSIRYGTILDSDKSERAEKSCLPSPLSDKPLEKLYGDLMVKHIEDAVTIFKYAISNGHVQQVSYNADLDEVFIRFSDNSTLWLAQPIPSRIIAEIWEESCKWEGRKLGERLKEIDREYEKERKESMNTKQMIPEVKLIQRRGRCTIVKWQDGTETKVVLEEGKPDTGIFGAYCIALAKKCAGSTEKLLRTIDDHDERVMKCRYLASVQELREKRLKKAAEERKRKWEEDVAAAMYDSRVRDEAIKRLWAKEEKEDI